MRVDDYRAAIQQASFDRNFNGGILILLEIFFIAGVLGMATGSYLVGVGSFIILFVAIACVASSPRLTAICCWTMFTIGAIVAFLVIYPWTEGIAGILADLFASFFAGGLLYDLHDSAFRYQRDLSRE